MTQLFTDIASADIPQDPKQDRNLNKEIKDSIADGRTVIDRALDNLSYTNLYDNYVPSETALEFVSFIKLVNGVAGEEHPTPIMHYKMIDLVISPGTRKALLAHRGAAKQELSHCKIRQKSKWTTMGEIEVGDWVLNRFGVEKQVISKTPPQYDRTFKMVLGDGSTTYIGIDHLHTVLAGTKAQKKGKEVNTVDTRYMLEKGLTYNLLPRTSKRNPKQQYRFKIPVCKPLEGVKTNWEVDPYVYGYSLANGTYNKDTVSFHADDAEEVLGYYNDYNYLFSHGKFTSNNGYQAKLTELNHKQWLKVKSAEISIPQRLMFAETEDRWELLRGLMDGDGSIAKNGSCRYSTYSKQLGKDIIELVKTLGGFAKFQKSRAKAKGSTEYTISIATHECPFKLKRKADKWKPTKRKSLPIVELTEIETDEASYCIVLDSEDHTYITDDYIVTHNSSVIIEYFVLYLAVMGRLHGFGDVPYVLYVSDSIDNGVAKMRQRIERRWQRSEFLQEFLPVAEFIKTRWYFKNKNNHEMVVTGHGINTGIRGTVELNSRPVIALADDVISDSDARSATIIEKVEDVMYSALTHALHTTRRKIVWVGTPFNEADPLYQAIVSGGWDYELFPVCAKFPCNRNEFEGSWEERFTFDFVKEEYKVAKSAEKLDSFYQELMLRVTSEDNRVLSISDVQWYSMKKMREFLKDMNIFITTDFAVSTGQHADSNAISVWGVNADNHWFWLDGILKKQLMHDTLNHLFDLVVRYSPKAVGVENSGQQAGFLDYIESEMQKRNVFFTLAKNKPQNGKRATKKGITPGNDKTKLDRFLPLVTQFKQGKVWFPEEMENSSILQEGIKQLLGITRRGFTTKHDDFIDTVTMMNLMDIWVPNRDTDASMFKSESSGEATSFWGTDDTQPLDDADYSKRSYFI